MLGKDNCAVYFSELISTLPCNEASFLVLFLNGINFDEVTDNWVSQSDMDTRIFMGTSLMHPWNGSYDDAKLNVPVIFIISDKDRAAPIS